MMKFVSHEATFILGMLIMSLILVIVSYFLNKKKRKCSWNDKPPEKSTGIELCEVCCKQLTDEQRLNEDLQISKEGKINKFCSEGHFDIFFRRVVEKEQAMKLMKEDKEKFKPPQETCPSVFRSARCDKLPGHTTLHWNKTLGYQWNDLMAEAEKVSLEILHRRLKGELG